MEIKNRDILNKKVIYVSGKIFCIDIIRLSKMLEKLLESEYEQIVVDLQGVDYIDSGGLGGLIYLKQIFLKNNKNLLFVVPRDKRGVLFRDCYPEDIFTLIDPSEINGA